MIEVITELLGTGDYVMNRLHARLDGMTDDEHLWEPQPGAWKVRPDGRVDGADPYTRPDPAPLTTLSWRLWHVGNENLCGFGVRAFDVKPLDITPDRWFPSATESRAKVHEAWLGLRAGIVAKGEPFLHQQMGPAWGPYEEATFAGLVLHILDEVIHHGAEVGMLRDLYRLSALDT